MTWYMDALVGVVVWLLLLAGLVLLLYRAAPGDRHGLLR